MEFLVCSASKVCKEERGGSSSSVDDWRFGVEFQLSSL
jgi:hypothetical protein